MNKIRVIKDSSYNGKCLWKFEGNLEFDAELNTWTESLMLS